MIRTRAMLIALLVTAVAVFVFAAGASSADRKIRVKVPGIT